MKTNAMLASAHALPHAIIKHKKSAAHGTAFRNLCVYWIGILFFWDEKGGVTFSGGEISLQKEFLKSALIARKESFIYTAVETRSFLENMQYVDFAFIDVKHMDNVKHLEKTGVPNTLILNNIRALAGLQWPGRIVLRIPIIAGFNDTEENMESTARFIESLGLFEINLAVLSTTLVPPSGIN